MKTVYLVMVLTVQGVNFLPLGRAAICLQGEYLVSGSRPVLDNQITASSVWDNHFSAYGPASARLHTTANLYNVGCWVAGINDQNPYIQVHLNGLSTITGYALQGRPNMTDPSSSLYGCCRQFVTSFRLLYSTDCTSFQTYLNNTGDEYSTQFLTPEANR
ncbi:uncharacterized protein LOC128205183 isoform X2 [Mya arenaria]|uniref:uncharacterized protein LOC128205183 isoform X2 n=1 Tax=Mya arenaria TaxID=6604 RepID=UPI0022E2E6D1|nr:uncharacterized protein LOC128205183 isoform X2 [Mya arenaria]